MKELKRFGEAAMFAIIPYLVMAPAGCTGTNGYDDVTTGHCTYPAFNWGLYLLCTIFVFIILGAVDSIRKRD